MADAAMANAALAKSSRQLRAQSSHDDAPPRKAGREGEAEDMPVDSSDECLAVQTVPFDGTLQGLAAMMTAMRTDMKEDMRKMKQMIRKQEEKAKKEKEAIHADVRRAVTSAERAAETASLAKEATAALKADVDKLKRDAVPHEIIEKAVEKMLDAKWPSLPQPGGPSGLQTMPAKGWGKGFGKSEATIHEQRRRTITFGQWPPGTRAEAIRTFMEETVVTQKDDVEEAYAYGKKFAERGAVRFKTEASMWRYMQDNAGNHKHKHNGQDIYVNVYDGGSSEADKDREVAVRKLTRAIIETVGGDGRVVRSDISASYKRGVVKYQGHEIGVWKEDIMELSEGGQQFAVAFRTLLGK